MTATAYQFLTVCALIDAGLALLVITLHDGLSYESGCCQPIVVYCFHNLVTFSCYIAYSESILS